MRAVHIDDGRGEALLGADDEAAGVVGDEVATRGFSEKVLFGDPADCRIDVDIGVMVARLAVREREAAGAENQNLTVAKSEVIEQQAADMPDIASVVRWLGIINQRGDRTVVLECPPVDRAVVLDRYDQIAGVGGFDLRAQPSVGDEGQGADSQAGRRRCPATPRAEKHVAGDEEQRTQGDGGRNAQPLHDQQRQRQRTQKGAQRRPVQSLTAGFPDAFVVQQVGEDRHRLPEQPGNRTDDAGDKEQIREARRVEQGEDPIDGDARQAGAGQRRRDQEVPRHDSEVAAVDFRAGVITEGQREQEEADRRRRDDDGAAHVRDDLAQCNDFGTERAEAFNEDDGKEQEAWHGESRRRGWSEPALYRSGKRFRPSPAAPGGHAGHPCLS